MTCPLDRHDGASRWDRYLGITAPMTQVPVPTATGRARHLCAQERRGMFFMGRTN